MRLLKRLKDWNSKPPIVGEYVTVEAFDKDIPWGPIHTMKKTFQQMVKDQIAEVRADATGPIDSSSYVTFLLETETKIFQIQSKRPLNPASKSSRLQTLVIIAAIAQRAAEDLKLMEEE